MEFSRSVVLQCHGQLPNLYIWACPCAKNLSNLVPVGSSDFVERISLKLLNGFPLLKFGGIF